MVDRYADIKTKLLEYAQTDDDIRCIVAIGSSTRKDYEADEFSDLDLMIVTKNPEIWFWGEYPALLGNISISFVEPTLGGGKERRIIYDEERDVDMIILTPEQFDSCIREGVAGWVMNRGYTVLCDKAGYEEQIKKNVKLQVEKPNMDEATFINIVNDFYFHNIWAYKKILRGENWSAKMCLDAYLKNYLLKLIELYCSLEYDVDVWHDGRFLDRWAEKSIIEELKNCFAHYEKEDMIAALKRTHDLFTRLARKVADNLGYAFPEKAEECVKQFGMKQFVTTIRRDWAANDEKRDAGLTTPDEIKRFDDVAYREHCTQDVGVNEKANLLDIYVPKNASGMLPAIINVHGGAFVYGNKEVYQYYCMQLALHGFVVVNINYRVAPESVFPAALEDVNCVLKFIEDQGDKYNIDKNNLILIGDSAGGQMINQYAAAFSNPEYAKLIGLTIPKVSIKALGHNCGLYDMKKSVKEDPDNMYFISYGKNPKSLTAKDMEQIDVLGHMTKNYPPSFVMSAQNDFFLEEAKALYAHLKNLGVDCELKIYGTEEQKEIGHCFHVNCNITEAKICNDEECAFFKKYV